MVQRALRVMHTGSVMPLSRRRRARRRAPAAAAARGRRGRRAVPPGLELCVVAAETEELSSEPAECVWACGRVWGRVGVCVEGGLCECVVRLCV